MKGLDMPALRIFVAAVEEKSLSKAADRENIVTSAASRRITELEGYLDKVLLHRHGRGVEPTPAGIIFYQRAKAILRSIQLAQDAISGFASDGQAQIRLVANPSTILQFLPEQMGRYLGRRHDVRVDLLECHSYDIPRLVSEGAADLGIYHAKSMAPGVVSYRYCRDRIGLVVPIGHPLALRSELFMEEALDYDLLGYFPRHSLEQFLDYIGPSISRPPKISLQVANFETRCRMIREGLGIGLMPERIAQGYLGSLGLSLLHLKDEWAERQSYVCARDPDDLRSGAAELLQFLREEGRALDNGWSEYFANRSLKRGI